MIKPTAIFYPMSEYEPYRMLFRFYHRCEQTDLPVKAPKKRLLKLNEKAAGFINRRLFEDAEIFHHLIETVIR
jgi:hypothetical protein